MNAAISDATPIGPQAQARPRLHYLDNLRAFIIVIVVVFHAAMNFMAGCPDWWPVIDTRSSLFFTWVVLLTDVPIMPVMFLIAGYFGLASLSRKGLRAFWQDKLLRIVLPWVAGVLIVAPFLPWLWLVSRLPDPPSFSYFWLHMFFTERFATQGALWFLGILTVFYLGLSAVSLVWMPLLSRSPGGTRPDFAFWIAFLALVSVVFMVINAFWPDYLWVPVKYILWVQPTRVSLEAFYFALGVLAYRQQWFAADGYRPKAALWLPVAIVAGWSLVSYKFMVGFDMPDPLVRGVHAILHCVFCLAATLALIGLFQRFANRTGPVSSRLSASSYGLYIVHLPLVGAADLLIRGQDWNIFVKYAVVSALALAASYLISAYGLSWLPMFGDSRRGSRPDAAAREPCPTL